MKSLPKAAVLACALFGLIGLTGCDQEIASTREVDVDDDGTVKTKEKTVTQDSDGRTTVHEEKTTTNP